MYINIIGNIITVSRAAAVTDEGSSAQCYELWRGSSGFGPCTVIHVVRPVFQVQANKKTEPQTIWRTRVTERASRGKLTEWRYVDFHLFLLRKEHVFKKPTRWLMCVTRDCVLFWTHRVYFTKTVMNLWCKPCYNENEHAGNVSDSLALYIQLRHMSKMLCFGRSSATVTPPTSVLTQSGICNATFRDFSF